jgi:catechol 2,3-dioxygenase-like lactoylglutathione lyase family enzyme
MDFRFELVVVPVSDVDAAKAFYADRLGWTVDVDHRAGESFRVVQLTPPGSACSVSIGTGITSAIPGSYRGMHLVVDDVPAARELLASRGAEVGEPFHFGAGGQTPGLHPERVSYGTFLELRDPDGNVWLVQEVPERALGR